jgi:hypothetical protein
MRHSTRHAALRRRQKIGPAVDNLWMTGANPVENLTAPNFLSIESAGTLMPGPVEAPFVITFA